MNSDAVEYKGYTIFEAYSPVNYILGIISNGTLVTRQLNILPSNLGDSHYFAIWSDSLVEASGDSVYVLPMSEVLSWK